MFSKTLPEYLTTNIGCKIPLIGLGTSNMEGVEDVIYNSIKDGTRIIDTAAMYKNEEQVGKAINKAISDGVVKREDLFVITKLNVKDRLNVEDSMNQSLKRLNLNYVDLYLDHWPLCIDYDENGKINYKAPLHVVWENMEKLVEKGLAKHIGVSNYNVQSLCNLLSFCKIKPSFLEVEFHPYLYQKNLLDFCRRENIIVLAYNPMVKGKYCLSHQNYTDILQENVILDLAKKYNKTPGQILLNWYVCLGVIPIPRTSNINRMKENLVSGKFILEEDDFNKICALNKNYRFCCFSKIDFNIFA